MGRLSSAANKTDKKKALLRKPPPESPGACRPLQRLCRVATGPEGQRVPVLTRAGSSAAEPQPHGFAAQSLAGQCRNVEGCRNAAFAFAPVTTSGSDRGALCGRILAALEGAKLRESCVIVGCRPPCGGRPAPVGVGRIPRPGGGGCGGMHRAEVAGRDRGRRGVGAVDGSFWYSGRQILLFCDDGRGPWKAENGTPLVIPRGY